MTAQLATPSTHGVPQYDAVAAEYQRLVAPRYAAIAALVDEAVGLVEAATDAVELAAGTGALTRLLAPRLLATGGTYTAVDISGAMLEQAAPTVDPRVRLLVADGSHTPLETASADLVVSSLGVLQASAAGWAEARRLLRADGRVVLTTWGDSYGERDLINRARRLLGAEPLPTNAVDEAAALARQAGFGTTSLHHVHLPAVHDSLESYLRYRAAFGTPAWIPPERAAEALDAIAAAAADFIDVEGRVVVDWTVAVLAAAAHD